MLWLTPTKMMVIIWVLLDRAGSRNHQSGVDQSPLTHIRALQHLQQKHGRTRKGIKLPSKGGKRTSKIQIFAISFLKNSCCYLLQRWKLSSQCHSGTEDKQLARHVLVSTISWSTIFSCRSILVDLGGREDIFFDKTHWLTSIDRWLAFSSDQRHLVILIIISTIPMFPSIDQ